VTIRDQKGAETQELVGCIVVATGAVPLQPQGQFGYNGRNVVTQIELEEKLRDGSCAAQQVVMIQCVGARCPERTYCSRICCLTAVKNALTIRERNPDAQVHILYRDIQMYGVENERILWEARGKGVRFDVYNLERPPVIRDGVVVVYQPLVGEVEEIPYDLVVLSTPLVAPENAPALANLMRLPLDQNNFFLEAHAKLRPLDFATDGIFLCGTARFPATVAEAQAQGLGAAARAATVLFKEKLVTSALVAGITDRCDGCALCLDVCPYHALKLEESEEGPHLRVKSDPLLCKGCGVCAATCPKDGVAVKGFTRKQLIAQIDAALEDP
jgi:heterodisulfide reductase subunit A